MSRLYLAFAAFFSLLLHGRLPERALALLPAAPPAPPPPVPVPEAAGPAPRPEAAGPAQQPEIARPAQRPDVARPAPRPEAAGPAPQPELARPARQPAPAVLPPQPAASQAAMRTEGALMLLTLLQREGRLLDFLRESLDGYDDAAIGVAVRDVHRDCRRVLEEHLELEPVMPGEEEQAVTVPRGFDPGEVRLIGKAEGEPPWKGVLVHHGWRVVDAKFPILADGVDRHVIAPAEVRVA